MDIRDGYVNIDAYVDDPRVRKYDLLNLPFGPETVHEIYARHLFEHIGFADEEKLFASCFRLLAKGGRLIVETPDMEWLCQKFLEGRDDFKAFYKVGAKDHYFGSGPSTENRWGMLTTHFWGNQNGPGQFHRNGYTEDKFKAVARLVGFAQCTVKKFMSKGVQSIEATFIK